MCFRRNEPQKLKYSTIRYCSPYSIYERVQLDDGDVMMVKGVYEMLQMAAGSGSKSFNDFTKISIKGKHLSSATVSKRLDELIKIEAIKETITRSKKGRRIITYKTTEKGRKVIAHARELEEVLAAQSDK